MFLAAGNDERYINIKSHVMTLRRDSKVKFLYGFLWFILFFHAMFIIFYAVLNKCMFKYAQSIIHS